MKEQFTHHQWYCCAAIQTTLPRTCHSHPEDACFKNMQMFITTHNHFRPANPCPLIVSHLEHDTRFLILPDKTDKCLTVLKEEGYLDEEQLFHLVLSEVW